MTTEEDTLPFDISFITPGTHEYELMQAADQVAKRNLEYFLAHEQEINERFPGPCTLVIYRGGEVRGYESFDELMDFLDTLDEVERLGALQFMQPDHGSIWAL